MNTHQTVTRQGWLSRLGGAIKGVLIGFIMVLAAFVLLFWNEGRAVKEAKSLREGAAAVSTADASRIDPANDGRLLHLVAQMQADAELRDPQLGVSARALRLDRQVEMYQWHERSETREEKQVGGSVTRTTTYHYDTRWSSSLQDSSRFQDPSRSNPSVMALEPRQFDQASARFGAYQAGPELLRRLGNWQPLAVDPATLTGPVRFRQGADGWDYSGDAQRPQVGDVRLRWRIVPEQTVSVVAAQQGSALSAWPTRAGNPVLLVSSGEAPAEAMFESAHARNRMISWALRVGGFVLMWVGLTTILRPLVVLADVLPWLGTLLGKGIGFVCMLVAGVLSLVTIAIAWIVFRPLLGIALLALAGGLVYALAKRRSQPLPQAAPAASPAA